MLVRVLLCALAVSVLGVRQNCVPVRNPLSNEYICTRVQKWINEVSALGENPTCSQMVNNDLIEAFSTVTEADDCSLNCPTPTYEEGYVKAYETKIGNAYNKYKPEQLRKLAGSALESGAKDTKAIQARLFKLLMMKPTDGIEDEPTEPLESLLNTQVKYVRMTAEEYLRRIKANMGDDCEVPRWPCCSELLRKLEEEALAKQLAEQAQAAAAAAAAASGTTAAAVATTTAVATSTDSTSATDVTPSTPAVTDTSSTAGL